jgi:hypothetical protein
MRVNGYCCDGCTKTHMLGPTRVLQYFGEGLPSTWLIVSRGNRDEDPMTFCSKWCLREWLSANLTANDVPVEVVPS